MPITYDIEQDSLYKEGLEQGKRLIILEMLKDATLTPGKIAQFTGTSIEFVERVKKEPK